MKLLKYLLAVFGLLSLASFATNAYYSDSVTTSGNSFSAGIWHVPEAKMVINEVYYKGLAEWVELYNVGDAAIDIEGWIICDNASHCGTLNPTVETEILPGGFVIVSHNASDLSGWSVNPIAEIIYYTGSKIAFNDTGDSVILKDASSNIIDQMSYLNNITLLTGQSLERNPIGTGSFTKNPAPTPGN